MKQSHFPRSESYQTPSLVPDAQPTDSRAPSAVGRRSFLKGLGVVGATLLPAGALLVTQGKAHAQSGRRLSKGDADLLRFAAWVEVVESDLWTQYNELGGATKPNDGSPNTGNPPYIAALQNLDGDMPRYISDNTDDELSHAAFLNAHLTTTAQRAGRRKLRHFARFRAVSPCRHNPMLSSLLTDQKSCGCKS